MEHLHFLLRVVGRPKGQEVRYAVRRIRLEAERQLADYRGIGVCLEKAGRVFIPVGKRYVVAIVVHVNDFWYQISQSAPSFNKSRISIGMDTCTDYKTYVEYCQRHITRKYVEQNEIVMYPMQCTKYMHYPHSVGLAAEQETVENISTLHGHDRE